MAIWQKADVHISLDGERTDHPVATIAIDTPSGRLFAMAEVVKIGRVVRLFGLHAHGDRTVANDVGARNLLLVVQVFMEVMDVDELVVTGGVRTTGANPGQAPRQVRFTRRPAD